VKKSFLVFLCFTVFLMAALTPETEKKLLGELGVDEKIQMLGALPESQYTIMDDGTILMTDKDYLKNSVITVVELYNEKKGKK